MAYQKSVSRKGISSKDVHVTWQDRKTFATIHAIVKAGVDHATIPDTINSERDLRPSSVHAHSVVSRTKDQPRPPRLDRLMPHSRFMANPSSQKKKVEEVTKTAMAQAIAAKASRPNRGKR